MKELLKMAAGRHLEYISATATDPGKYPSIIDLHM